MVDGEGEIGLISSVSHPFCTDCSRARLTADGKLVTCLFAKDGHDLLTPLRSGAEESHLLEMISEVWENREDRYSEARRGTLSHPARTKVEMSYVGG